MPYTSTDPVETYFALDFLLQMCFTCCDMCSWVRSKCKKNSNDPKLKEPVLNTDVMVR